MRRVKIVSTLDVSHLVVTSWDLEKPLNSAFEEIWETGGEIVKTEYCVTHSGSLHAIIIEYEVR